VDRPHEPDLQERDDDLVRPRSEQARDALERIEHDQEDGEGHQEGDRRDPVHDTGGS
jgi:hypothetical protein